MKLKITSIGNSAGVILPKEVLARLRLEKGDELYLLETPDDESVDDVVSIERMDPRRIVITTYKKEILLTLTEEPFVEPVEE